MTAWIVQCAGDSAADVIVLSAARLLMRGWKLCGGLPFEAGKSKDALKWQSREGVTAAGGSTANKHLSLGRYLDAGGIECG